jgi:thymidine kinase
MFTEDSINPQNRSGWIEIITGSMFSGKTEELIRRVKRARIANQKVKIFKPKIDTRYSSSEVISHDENAIHSQPVNSSFEIIKLCESAEVVGIDEAQFFDSDLPKVCDILANKGIRVIVAGLDMDFLGKPFGPVPELLSISEYITKVHAICVRCGNLAHYTHRKSTEQQRVLIGELDIYEPLCRKCFQTIQQAI